MATIDVKDAAGLTVAVEKPNANGRALAAASRPVAIDTESKAVLDALSSSLTTIAGYLDTVETLLGSANTLATTLNGYVDGLEGYVDGIETLIGTTNSSLTTIAGYVDGLEGYLDGVETAIASTNTKLDTLHTDLTTVTATLTEQQAQTLVLEDIRTASEATVSTLPKRPLETATGLTHAFSTGSASGERAALVSATASQTTRVHRITVTAGAATVVELRDGASGTALKTFEFPAAGAYVFDFDERPYAITTANTALILYSSVATKVTADFDYIKSA